MTTEPPQPWVSGLDIPLTVTFFRDALSRVKHQATMTLRDLVPRLRDTRGPDKASLPWLKLAEFGERRTDRGSLRNNDNIISIFGVEADYDASAITLDRCRQIVSQAALAAIIYTSPSHTPTNPKWRILCPTSCAMPPADRAALLARLNGLFVGALAPESFTLSQSYYYGAVGVGQFHEVFLLDGRPIDLASELAAGAIGRPTPPRQEGPAYLTQISDGEATNYGRRALAEECASIRHAPDGGKHAALNKAAYSIGGLVAGGDIDQAFALDQLRAALSDIRARCQDYAHAEKTLRVAFEDGLRAPRQKPDGPPPPARAMPFGIGAATQSEPAYGPAFAADDQARRTYDAETGEVIEAPNGLIATPFNPADLLGLEPRRWVYGHFLIRRFLSVLGAPGGTGKTAYAIAVGISVAINVELVGEKVYETGPVWIYNLEDPRDEMLRRVYAACLHHNIDPAVLANRLYLDSGREKPLVLAEKTPDGGTVALPIVDELVAEVKRRGVRLLIIDPFVKSHRLEENRNEHVDFAATLWNLVADRADCAILLLHHFRKGGQSGDVDAFRGAVALTDASRAAVSVATMSEKEAGGFGIEPAKRRFFVRADNAKLNLAPPPEETLWLEMHNVDLPNGDKVGAISQWKPPNLWEGLAGETIVNILVALNKPPKEAEQWTINSRSKSRWAGRVIVENSELTAEQAVIVLRAWEKNGLISETRYTNAKREEATGLEVNQEEFRRLNDQYGVR